MSKNIHTASPIAFLPMKLIIKYWELISIVIVLIIYLLLFYSKFHLYQHQINPDALSYIGIAQKFSNGDFKDALNSYWPPMLSFSELTGWLEEYNFMRPYQTLDYDIPFEYYLKTLKINNNLLPMYSIDWTKINLPAILAI